MQKLAKKTKIEGKSSNNLAKQSNRLNEKSKIEAKIYNTSAKKSTS